jgi:alpha-beta hydrolase superfamily lysophospholipase
VGDFTKGVKSVFEMFKKQGMNDLDLKFYKDARHDVFNETNRIEVFEDVVNWLRSKS